MGHKEDLVRQRIEREKQIREKQQREDAELADKKAREIQTERERLMSAIEAETKRIADIFEDADWSQAELVTFTTPKKRWWSRVQHVEYAMLHATGPRRSNFVNGYIRSDGAFFFRDGYGKYFSANQYLANRDYDIIGRLLNSLKKVHGAHPNPY